MLAPWSKIRLLRGAVYNCLKKLLKKLASYYIESMQNKRTNTTFLFIDISISVLHLNDNTHIHLKASNLVQDISNDNNQ